MKKYLLLFCLLPAVAAAGIPDNNPGLLTKSLKKKQISSGGIGLSFYQVFTRYPYLCPGTAFNRLYRPPQLFYNEQRTGISAAWHDPKKSRTELSADDQLFLMMADPRFRTGLIQPEFGVLFAKESFLITRTRLNFMWRGFILRTDYQTFQDRQNPQLEKPLQSISVLGGFYLLTFPGFQMSLLAGRSVITAEERTFETVYALSDSERNYSRFETGVELRIYPVNPITLEGGILYDARTLCSSKYYMRIGFVIPLGRTAVELLLGFETMTVAKRYSPAPLDYDYEEHMLYSFALRWWL